MFRSAHPQKRSGWSRLRASVWFFPAVLTAILLLLSGLRISGTSIGIYDKFFNGANSKDSHLLFGAPQPIRSDEWLVNTQLTIAQARDGFPRINHNITGDGRDMSLDIDVPYKEWSVIFKPQNLAFLVLPLEVAFAFKWWLLLYLLILSVYFFTLRLFPGRRLLAVLTALGFGFSPFVFWWYQTTTIASLFYGFFILILGMRILNGEPVQLPQGGRRLERRTSFIIYTALLTYLLVSFALVFYPPFQVPVAIGVAAFLLGYLLKLRFSDKLYGSLKQLLKPLALFGVALVLTGAIGLAFVKTRSQALGDITHTVYPGARVVSAGGFPVDRMLATFLQPQLQRGAHGPHYYTNQSESSNFILLLPYLLIPGVVLTVYDWRKRGCPDWVFVGIQGAAALLLANLFVPHFQLLYHLLMLDKVPHERLALGLGFIGLLHLLYTMKLVERVKVGYRKLTMVAAGYTLICLGVGLLVGRYTHQHFPLFIGNKWLIIALVAAFCLIIYMVLIRRFVLAMGLLLAFAFVSIVHIHPLYQGLGILAHNRVVDTMESVSGPKDTWATLDQIYLENFGLLSDRNSLSGVQFYPDIPFWRQIEGPAGDAIYNRYAHVVFTANPDFPAIQLMQLDSFIVKFACTPFVEQHITYVLTQQPLFYGCVEHVSTITYPAQTFYIYRVR